MTSPPIPRNHYKPELALNRADDTVADALNIFLNGAADGLADEIELDIATAYFNVGGYCLLADALDRVGQVRLLLGAEPNQLRRRRVLTGANRESPNRTRAERARVRRSLETHQQEMEFDRDLLGFTFEAEAGARRLVDWLHSGRVQVRRLQNRFLHGKAFVVRTLDHGVVAGSSNFTFAGLHSNVELNLGGYSPHVVTGVSGWFDELWDEAEPYDLAALFETRFEPHEPQLIYLRMLWERYQDELLQQSESGLELTEFQRHGLGRAKNILKDYNGVLIADEVGLGKTFIAGELILEATRDRRQRVLVVTPATLRDGPWKTFRDDHNLNIELVSFDDLARDENLNRDSKRSTGQKLAAEPDEYAMVVVDEAHNLRNPSSQRALAMRNLLNGSPPKQLILMTATPVNNSLWDLYYLLTYFLVSDGQFADVGIRSLREHFDWAMKQDPEDLLPTHLFDVLDAVAVRRTRQFVKKHYRNETVTIGGNEQHVSFPTPRVLRVDYDLDSVLPGFFDRVAAALEPNPESSSPPDGSTAEPASVDPLDTSNRSPLTEASTPRALTLARYTPSGYLLSNTGDPGSGTKVEAYEMQNAGLLRSALLKRFESSPYAFVKTCKTMVHSHDAFLQLLPKGKVATGEALADWINTDSDDANEVDVYLDLHQDILESTTNYDVMALTEAVTKDRDLLEDLADTASKVTRDRDPNLAVIVEELANISAEAKAEGLSDAQVRNKGKVLIFSYFADTVNWVYEHLKQVTGDDERLAPYRDRVASLSGSEGSKARVLWGFAPETTGARSGSNEDLYDIVVTTDVLAEGVNLQQCRHIINYDLPWNPMRLVQRHGRIDRIGSFHDEVFIRCVFPDAQLNSLLGLQDRIQRKIRQAAASVGVGQDIIPDEPGAERNFAETPQEIEKRQRIEQLRGGDSELFVSGGPSRGTISGEEFRRELQNALEDEDLAERLKTLAWGSGSAMIDRYRDPGDPTGFVFCVRVGDWEKPIFRYVEINSDPGTGSHGVLHDTLECLDRARPPDGWDTPQDMDEHTRRLAFQAWKTAADDIELHWNQFADKASFEPKLPKALHDAQNLLRQHAPSGRNQTDIDNAVDALSVGLTELRVRVIRNAMRSADGDPSAQAEAVLREVKNLGLKPVTPPEPLPPIKADDVHLVCWQALRPPTD